MNIDSIMKEPREIAMKRITEYVTGSCRGYIHVADRGEGTEFYRVPETVNGLRGNVRWAMRKFIDRGCTHYTVSYYQGVPGKGYSNQYYYVVYTGYKA